MKLLKKPSALWVAEQRGSAVFLLAGRAGAPGKPKVRELKTAEDARAFLEAERDKKIAEGYKIIDEDAGLSAPFTVDGAPRKPPAIPAKYSYLDDTLRTHVRGGFTPADEMDRVIDDLLECEPGAPRSLRAHLEEVARTERQELRRMIPPSPCVNDAIDAAFAELTAIGVIALQNAGFTQSDGWADVHEANADRARRGGGKARGGCFYHFQDLERGVKGQGLMLGFAAFGPEGAATDAETLAVGRTIVEVLQKHGVDVEWDGSAAKRIRILPFPWFRRA